MLDSRQPLGMSALCFHSFPDWKNSRAVLLLQSNPPHYWDCMPRCRGSEPVGCCGCVLVVRVVMELLVMQQQGYSLTSSDSQTHGPGTPQQPTLFHMLCLLEHSLSPCYKPGLSETQPKPFDGQLPSSSSGHSFCPALLSKCP